MARGAILTLALLMPAGLAAGCTSAGAYSELTRQDRAVFSHCWRFVGADHCGPASLYHTDCRNGYQARYASLAPEARHGYLGELGCVVEVRPPPAPACPACPRCPACAEGQAEAPSGGGAAPDHGAGGADSGDAEGAGAAEEPSGGEDIDGELSALGSSGSGSSGSGSSGSGGSDAGEPEAGGTDASGAESGGEDAEGVTTGGEANDRTDDT